VLWQSSGCARNPSCVTVNTGSLIGNGYMNYAWGNQLTVALWTSADTGNLNACNG